MNAAKKEKLILPMGIILSYIKCRDLWGEWAFEAV
jgi:hypothetical protein